jgi:hypothetical protein
MLAAIATPPPASASGEYNTPEPSQISYSSATICDLGCVCRLYRNDPGHEMELLCHQAPKYGAGNVTTDK